MFPFVHPSAFHGHLEAGLARLRHSETRLRRMQRERVAALEDQLAQTTLLAVALGELCVKKGVLTHAEIADAILALGGKAPESTS